MAASLLALAKSTYYVETIVAVFKDTYVHLL